MNEQEEYSLTKTTSTENLKARIASQRGSVKKARGLYDNETNEQIKAIRKAELDNAERELSELEQELDTVLTAKKGGLRKQLEQVIENNHIAYIASDSRYIFIKNYSKTESRVNLVVQNLTWKPLVGILNNLLEIPGKFNDMDEADLRLAFETAKASYMIKTASFDDPKWDSKYVFNTLDVQRQYWAPIDRGTDYNPLFDDVIYTLAGGKQENIDHLETWIAYKYLNPDKVKITPGLNITGIPGGNGKGLFGQMLTSIFTPMGVSVVKGKNYTGGFNAIMEGKVIALLDDEKKDKFPNDELKQNSGNGSIVIEPKGIDAYTVDSTASTIVLDNTGLVKLVGGGAGGEDRRWSIIITNLTLLEHLAQKYQLTGDEPKQLAEQIGMLFENRIECGKYVAAVIDRHNVKNMPVLLPLHGEDYRARLLEQRDNWTEIFEQILPVFVNQGVLPFKFLVEIVEAITGDKIRKAQTLSSKFDEFMSRKGFKNMEKVERATVLIGYGKYKATDKFRGAVRRLDETADTFDYSMISTTMYDKKVTLTKDAIQIRDFNEELEAKNTWDDSTEDDDYAEDDDVFTDRKINPANPATPRGLRSWE